jgi:hypothetical protein
MKKFLELIKKHGFATITGAMIFEGTRRAVFNDKDTKIQTEIRGAFYDLSQREQQVAEDKLENARNSTEYNNVVENLKPNSASFENAREKYNPCAENKKELDIVEAKFRHSLDGIQKLDISDFFLSFYNKYNAYLDSLSSFELVCLFNIIMDLSFLSLFTSILSIMLSDKIIHKIVVLDKYPRLQKILKIRTSINKSVSKAYLIYFLILLILTLIGNIYLFFL